MRAWILTAAVLAAAVFSTGCACPCGGAAGKANLATASGMVRHVVLFKFKDGTTPEQIKAIEADFRALPSKIPEIAGFEWGTDCSPEKLSQGFTHCFFLTFSSAAARDAYLPHPAHKAFGQGLGPHLDKVLVIDYVAGP